MNRVFLLLTFIGGCILLTLGCSGVNSPSIPATDLREPVADEPGISAPITSLWGYYDVYLDIPGQSVTVEPNRSSMFAANVVQFLNGNPADLAFNVNNIYSTAEYIDVDIDVTITHPFPGMEQYNGYDVRGIFIGNGSQTLAYNTDIKYAGYNADDQVMYDYNEQDDGKKYGNPDGYTRWFNPIEFDNPGLMGYMHGIFASKEYFGTARLNPYKYFADGLTVGGDTWEFLNSTDMNGVFAAGSDNTRNYYLRFPSPSPGVKYAYAIVANWEGTDPGSHPSNASEAVAVNVVDNSDLYYVSPSENGGNLILDISLWDWDSTVNPSGIMDSYTIFIESSVLSGVYEATAEDMTPVEGGEHYSTYHFEIPADNVTGPDGNECWIIVQCSDKDYSNTFNILNDAWEDPLSAFFRFNLIVTDEPPEPPEAGWARTWGSSDSDEYAYGVTADSQGNAYVSGIFATTVDFDPGTPNVSRTSNGGWDCYLSKFDKYGNFVWVKTWGGPADDFARAVNSDGTGVYVGGWFAGTVEFNPAGGDSRSALGSSDGWMSKFDFNGNFQWVKTWGGYDTDHVYCISADGNGGVYAGGAFASSVLDFTGSGGGTINNNGDWDCYIVRFTSSGSFGWAKNWGSWSGEGNNGVAGTSSKVYATGSFNALTNFNPGGTPVWKSPIGGTAAYCVCFDTSGTYQWVVTWADYGTEYSSSCSTDSLGNAYVVGSFDSSITLEPGNSSSSKSSNGAWDVWIVKLNSQGAYQWGKTWGGPDNDQPYITDADNDGNVYISGYFRSNSVDFNPDGGDPHNNKGMNGEPDVYLSRFSTTGAFSWALSWGSSGQELGLGIGAKYSPAVYLAGIYADTVEFNPAGGDPHTVLGGQDDYLLKVLPGGTW